MRSMWAFVGLFLAAGSGICALYFPTIANADEGSRLNYNFNLNLERTGLDNLSLGDDPDARRLVTEDYEFEVELEYSINGQLHLFLELGLINETETVTPQGERQAVSGLERKQMGIAVGFGDDIVSELKLGRREFVSVSRWWVWWDEKLDAISVESDYASLTGLLAVAEEQARESTGTDMIDPQLQGVQRIIASLGWAFANGQALFLYYLDQVDRSTSFALGDLEETERIDPLDADLSWWGISYLGGFEFETLGKIEFEWHYARVSGNESIYQFIDTDGGRAEVAGILSQRVGGSAQGYLLSWNPAALDDWYFILGAVRGSGDDNPGDGRDKSFRQTGLQGDSEAYGELYQPEISNLSVQAVGVAWEIVTGVEIALFGYDYEQLHLHDELRAGIIELDPNGIDRELGREIDLMLTVEALDGAELTLIAAEFGAGAAYGARAGERSHFVSLQLDYNF